MEKEKTKKFTVNRRGFITTMGIGAAAVVTSCQVVSNPQAKDITVETVSEIDPLEMTKIKLQINGQTHRVLVEPRWTLLFVLREKLGLTGAKIGCERGECGACTVLIDDIPRYACMTLAMEAERKNITTLEGLMQGENPGPVQESFAEKDAFQCGYCTPGQIMAAEGLLRKNPEPDEDTIRREMSGNLCRCGAYTHIFSAVKDAAKRKRG